MNRRSTKILWGAVCLILFGVCAGIFGRNTSALPGRMYYVYGYGEAADSWQWKLMEQDVVSGEEKVICQCDSELFLIDCREGGFHYAETDEDGWLVIRNIETGGIAWQGDASAVRGEWTGCFAFDREYLYFADQYKNAAYVKRLDARGNAEILMSIESDEEMRLSCFSISPRGSIAFMKEKWIDEPRGGRVLHSYVHVYEEGEERLAAEGAYPFWNGEQLCFLQGYSLMARQIGGTIYDHVRAGNGKEIRLDAESLLTAPDSVCSGGYLVV